MNRRCLLLGMTAGALLAAGCGGAPGPAPSVGLRLRTDWTRRPSGAMPAAGDDGVPFVLRASGITAGPRVDRGALVADLPDGHAAAYVNQHAGRAVRRIGARVGFVPGPSGRAGDDGSVCLAAWSGALPPSDPGVVEAPVHLVVTPNRWIYGVATGSRLRPLAEGRHARPLPTDGTPVRVEAVLDGPRAELALPDGSTRVIEDAAIARLAAPIACWEFYRDAPGGAAVRLYETWAG